ncbi:hypothetical protein [Streptomyces javensis]|nr:hypothetical protein [Streptomyces javensis]
MVPEEVGAEITRSVAVPTGSVRGRGGSRAGQGRPSASGRRGPW